MEQRKKRWKHNEKGDSKPCGRTLRFIKRKSDDLIKTYLRIVKFGSTSERRIGGLRNRPEEAVEKPKIGLDAICKALPSTKALRTSTCARQLARVRRDFPISGNWYRWIV
ncbi:hypothetical protein TNCV_2537341 [Trichonephila clavipes]|nr:hypothetical protein TNCV_2537341 [Trichonephila clavipes]